MEKKRNGNMELSRDRECYGHALLQTMTLSN